MPETQFSLCSYCSVTRTAGLTLLGLLGATLSLPAQTRRPKPDRPKYASDAAGLVTRARAASKLANSDRSAARAAFRVVLSDLLNLPKASTRADAMHLAAGLANSLRKLGDLRSAHRAMGHVVRYRTETKHPLLQESRLNYALLESYVGDPKEALRLQESVYAVWSKSLQPDDRRMQSVRLNLSSARKKAGDRKGARKLLEAALAIAMRGPADALALQKFRVNLAILLRESEEHPKALELLTAAHKTLSRTVPATHRTLQIAKLNLGITKLKMGDARSAHPLLETVVTVWSKMLPAASPPLDTARLELASAKRELGDLEGARAIETHLLALLSKLPEGHPRLLLAQAATAQTLKAMNRMKEAGELYEKVYRVWSRSHPEHAPNLQNTRMALALVRKRLGDTAGAHALETKLVEVWEKTLPPKHHSLQKGRINLALTKIDMGRLREAQPLLQRAHSILEETMPADHDDLLGARQGLANVKLNLGDAHGALNLLLSVERIWARKLPPGHKDLRFVRHDLAAAYLALGKSTQAHAILQRLEAHLSKARAATDSELLDVRQNLAIAKQRIGDMRGALALEEEVFAVMKKTRAHDDPGVQRARINLGATRLDCGRAGAAAEVLTQAYEIARKIDGSDDQNLQPLRLNLIAALLETDDAERAIEIAREKGRAARRILARWVLSPRALGALALAQRPARGVLLSLIHGRGKLAPQPQLAEDALLTLMVLRGIRTRAARVARSPAGAAARAAHASLALEVERATNEVTRLSRMVVEDSTARAARSAAFSKAIRQRDGSQKRLYALAMRAQKLDPAALSAKDVAARLPPKSAAISYSYYSHWKEAAGGKRSSTEYFVALTLRRDGTVESRRLAKAERVLALVDEVRRTRARSDRESEAARAELRKTILDPVTARLDGVDRLFLSLPPMLQLAPLDGLPLEGGRVDDRYRLHTLTSLLDFFEPGSDRRPATDSPRLLVVGGVDFGKPAATPGGGTHRGGEAFSFPHLQSALAEALAVSDRFRTTFPGGKVDLRRREEIGRKQLVTAVRGAEFIHLATHAYARVSADVSATARSSGVAQLSPLTMCGLALSGANLPPLPDGRRPGIITGEQILGLDLSAARLVVLSACDTSLGIHNVGQGLASLRVAVIGAGARYVLTSLWEVDDAWTKKLMTEFYTQLWQHRRDPHDALRRAKATIRTAGAGFADWAGWVMVGQ